mmetsp:Transcript_9139/g.22510  ORF Transcript_9139/g.22510 Transcript_9139/m.22510 type:complete len:341 (-) Transcript_9139:674-1696(-)
MLPPTTPPRVVVPENPPKAEPAPQLLLAADILLGVDAAPPPPPSPGMGASAYAPRATLRKRGSCDRRLYTVLLGVRPPSLTSPLVWISRTMSDTCRPAAPARDSRWWHASDRDLNGGESPSPCGRSAESAEGDDSPHPRPPVTSVDMSTEASIPLRAAPRPPLPPPPPAPVLTRGANLLASPSKPSDASTAWPRTAHRPEVSEKVHPCRSAACLAPFLFHTSRAHTCPEVSLKTTSALESFPPPPPPGAVTVTVIWPSLLTLLTLPSVHTWLICTSTSWFSSRPFTASRAAGGVGRTRRARSASLNRSVASPSFSLFTSSRTVAPSWSTQATVPAVHLPP